MINQAKKDLKTIYQGVIDNKNFDDMKSNFEGKNVDLDDLKEAFEDLKEDMTSYSTTTLKKIDFKDMEVRSHKNGTFILQPKDAHALHIVSNSKKEEKQDERVQV